MRALLLALGVLAAGPAWADEPEYRSVPFNMNCYIRQDLVEWLAAEHSEIQSAFGVRDGSIYELWVSPSGSFTVVLTMGTGLACMVASGQQWSDRPVGDPA